MQGESIIAIRRGKMFFIYSIALVIVVIFFALLVYFEVISPDELTNRAFLIFISIIFIIPYLLAFLKYIDKKPLIIIDRDSISIRKSRFPFSGLKQINWNDIEEYQTKIVRFKDGVSKFLTIKQKSTGKNYYVDLFDLKTDNEDLLTELRRNLQKHKKAD